MTVKCDKNSTLRFWKFSAFYLASRSSPRRGNPITSDPLTGMSGEAWGGLCWLLVGLSLIHPKGENVSVASAENDPVIVLKGIITGLIVVCSNVVICDPWTEAWLQRHSTTADCCAVWLNKKTVYTTDWLLNMISLLGKWLASHSSSNPLRWVKWIC